MNELTQFSLDGDALAELVNICTKEGKTPSEVIAGIIHQKAVEAGIVPVEV